MTAILLLCQNIGRALQQREQSHPKDFAHINIFSDLWEVLNSSRTTTLVLGGATSSQKTISLWKFAWDHRLWPELFDQPNLHHRWLWHSGTGAGQGKKLVLRKIW